jgi:hypothetical protein
VGGWDVRFLDGFLDEWEFSGMNDFGDVGSQDSGEDGVVVAVLRLGRC